MEGEDEVTLWKAPQPGRDAGLGITAGFDPAHYPGDGPYFALERMLAEEYQEVYQHGLQELHLPQGRFAELVREGVIRPDAYYPGRSCHVPPGRLADFNEALRQGRPNVYHPQPE